MNAFGSGEQVWTDRLGNLRNTVRQALIARQLAAHVRPGSSVLDVGCGQGTQAVRLAALDCTVTGADPSPNLLALARAAADRAGYRIELLNGELADLPDLLGSRRFDLVCAHGLLMYLEDVAAGIESLAQRVHPGGLLSITFRNGDALGLRPAMRRDWSGAVRAFDSDTYTNELGVTASAHRLEDMAGQLDRLGFDVEAWYGVRLFTDAADADEPVPTDLDALIEAEWIASHRDPYRALGAQIHLIARRRDSSDQDVR